MLKKAKVLGLVLARSGSKGLKDKNILPLMGQPLLCWPIKTLLGVPDIDKVLVSTDSEEYQKLAILTGADVPFLRPKHLSSDNALSIDVIEHAICYLANRGESYDYVVLLEPTSPFTEGKDVSDALELLRDSDQNADAVVGVGLVEDQHPSFLMELSNEGLLRPFNGKNKIEPTRRQRLSQLFYLDGSLYASKTSVLLNLRTFYHSRTLAKKMEKRKNLEIDTIEDFIMAEALAKFYLATKQTNQ